MVGPYGEDNLWITMMMLMTVVVVMEVRLMPWDFHIHIVKDGQCHVMVALLNTRMRVVVRGSDMGNKGW